MKSMIGVNWKNVNVFVTFEYSLLITNQYSSGLPTKFPFVACCVLTGTGNLVDIRVFIKKEVSC